MVEIRQEQGRFVLWLTGTGFLDLKPALAGPRLYCGGNWPSNINFQHENQDQAEKDADRLERYLLEQSKESRPTRRKDRPKEADANSSDQSGAVQFVLQ